MRDELRLTKIVDVAVEPRLPGSGGEHSRTSLLPSDVVIHDHRPDPPLVSPFPDFLIFSLSVSFVYRLFFYLFYYFLLVGEVLNSLHIS